MTNRKQSNWSSSKRKVTAAYRKNRDIVRNRDQGICVRCFMLTGRIVLASDCDHLQNVNSGGTDDLSNLWMLCKDCHRSKTQRESNGLIGFDPIIDYDTGWPIPEMDWKQVISERNREYFKPKSFSL
ncbi:hypothetical protein GQF56_07200 [Rhodobacter sphaeroides]|uniref:Class I holin n=3 Tax=Cereibacter sphaeroides TaxID=1063 RepID=Q3J216_CERS4|nr:putative class I holin [Cereibacter sphaeroides 2.4.1]MVX47658.1 hypothetical protein [Cereibacter sphaeroides]AXC62836.1 HNH endonuclease [Cereibacter sphaeroides 2.4.1]QHA10971.1 hypothetical protein GQR99_08385 [Cereibacter sphaeroides]QHA13460.1 hypothetical protein GQY06_08365 [Cereibacter sphaeroides]